MEQQTRNFSTLKSDKFDDEGLETVTSKEQVSELIICGFIYILDCIKKIFLDQS
jgi:hypothetical protein